jgi:hypothetical protein
MKSIFFGYLMYGREWQMSGGKLVFLGGMEGKAGHEFLGLDRILWKKSKECLLI